MSALLIDGLNSRFGGTVTIEDKLIMADVTSGKILIADGASYEEQAVSGDITINSSGVTAISSGVIVNADISGSALLLIVNLQLLQQLTRFLVQRYK